LQGRPYGGCAIFWRRDIRAAVNILNTDSRRVCALRVSNNNYYNLLLINVYMPFESDEFSSNAFNCQLAVVNCLIAQNPDCHCIIGGDFNVDFSRNWSHTGLLNSFCVDNNLNPVIKHSLNSVDYTYNFNMMRFNILDNFLLSGVLFDTAVQDVRVLHCVDNTSDHDPLVLDLNIDLERVAHSSKVSVDRIAWYKADANHIDVYKRNLAEALNTIVLPTDALLCHNVLCSNSEHIIALDDYCKHITEACLSASKCSIPHSHNSTDKDSKRPIPGWSEYVEPARAKALFWHNIWVDDGRKKTGIVADIMRKTRLQYHYAIRRVKKSENDIVADRFAESVLNNSERDFWSEVKRMRGKSCTVSNVVDGSTTPDSISDVFAHKYQDLYSSVSYSESEMSSIVNELNNALSVSGFNSDCIINHSDVVTAVNKLKPGKNDGNIGLTSDHIKFGCNELFVHMSFLLTSILSHGCVPDDLLVSTVVPIPKGRNLNLTDSANYRGITLSSIFGKVFDLIVLNRYSDSLVTSDLQFGFKAKRSTNMCTLILKECLAYYTSNNSTVFCTMLDATKAFDKVEYSKLFRQLMARNIPPIVIRMLLNMYVNHTTRVTWNGVYSNKFSVKNGVKQGGILSPVLFCIYFDGLLCRLAKTNIGCFIGNIFVGALAYADDVVLLAPTPHAMRILLAVCDAYADEYQVVFNAKKSKCIVCSPQVTGNNNNLLCFTVGGILLSLLINGRIWDI